MRPARAPVAAAAVLVGLAVATVALVAPACDATNRRDERDAACCSGAERVDASCWGFDAADSTYALQSAIDCASARTVFVPYVASTDGVWTVQPIRLNTSSQTVQLDSGVTVMARSGYFHGLHDCLFSAIRVTDVSLVGAADGTSRLVMRKADYANSSVYQHSEWRHGVEINGCVNFTLRAVVISLTGGDGVYVGVNARATTVSGVHVTEAYRNGMSVTGAIGLVVESSTFTRASGTCCWGGIDIEPEAESHAIQDIVIRNCSFGDNKGNNFVLSLGAQTQRADTIRVLNSTVYGGESGGILVLNVEPNPYGGAVLFQDVLVRGTPGVPVAVQHKSAAGAGVVFDALTIVDAGRKHDVHTLIAIAAGAYGDGPVGAVTFHALTVYDTRNRTFLEASSSANALLVNVTGDAAIYNPFAASAPDVVCAAVFRPANCSVGDGIQITACALPPDSE